MSTISPEHSTAIGHRAPTFSLRSTTGEMISLDGLLGAGPLVVWYSNGNGAARLRQLRDFDHKIEERGARVVVISPSSATETQRLAAAVGGTFTFLADPERSFARELGVWQRDGVRASAFVLDRSGTVRWRYRAHGTNHQPRASKVVGALTSSSGLPIKGPSAVLTPTVAVLTLSIVASLALLARFADHALLSWDEPIRGAIRGAQGPVVRPVMDFMTKLGDRYLLLPLTLFLAWLVWDRCRQMGAVLLVALPLGLAVEFFIKFLVARPRPSRAVGLNSSFPSGHTLAATAFWLLLPPLLFILTEQLWIWRVSIVAVLLIVLGVGVSRVYVSAHWPSDIVAAYLAGGLILLVMEWFLRSRVFQCDGCPLHPLRYGRRR
jgi:undecaprenyl-diphosphatase